MLRGKEFLKKAFCVVSSLMMITGYCISPIIATSRAEQRRQAKADLQNKRKELANELKNAKDNVNEEAEKKKNLDAQIEILQKQIDESNAYIDDLDGEIADIEKQIDEIHADMDHKVVLLKNSLASIYVAGDTTTLDIILGAKSFEDFLDKADIVRSVSQTIQKLIDELKADLKEIETKKEELEKTKSDKETEKSDLESNRVELQDLVDKSEELLKKLESDAQDVQKRIDQNDAAIKAIDDEIAREQRRLEEERKRQVEQGRPIDSGTVASGDWAWPVPGYHYISSGFNDSEGRSHVHGAIDIAGGGIYGANVVAANSGTVIMVCTDGRGGGYGNYIVIDHGNGKSTLYGHLSCVSVSRGQRVSKAQKIGNVGNTGFSTGPHLHFEYRVNGMRTNPRSIV
ncbi:MAG: peptidoglycan DD-metalloendopeptidase family protein [Clostridia bacterium]|nr:peptidoglycan DD-metalloendopeptidase family protein [Clostridia bacterium]